MTEPKWTRGEWRLVTDAQGPCMIMHPTRHGVAIASLTNTHLPTGGFHDDWHEEGPGHATTEERNANANLIAAAPDLYEACVDVESKIVDFAAGRINWRPDDFLMRVRAALAKARGES